MHDLNDMRLFASVAHAGSFTSAADQLGIPKSTISRRLSRLERSLGVLLIERTTRRLRITDAGQIYLSYCERVHSEAEQAEAAVHRLLEAPSGVLQISAPLDIGQSLLTPILVEFLQHYPDIEINCSYTNRFVDLLEEGFDVVLRIGRLQDSSLVARRLGNPTLRLFANPDYLRARGIPKTPQDLTKHDLLVMTNNAKYNRWKLQCEDESVSLPLAPRVTVNDFNSVLNLARNGAGIALLPTYLCAGADDLRMVLKKWRAPSVAVSAFYPSHRGATPKLKVFLSFLTERLVPRLNLDTA